MQEFRLGRREIRGNRSGIARSLQFDATDPLVAPWGQLEKVQELDRFDSAVFDFESGLIEVEDDAAHAGEAVSPELTPVSVEPELYGTKYIPNP